MCQYDPALDRKIIVGHCDPYFMVQCLFFISERVFNVRGDIKKF